MLKIKVVGGTKIYTLQNKYFNKTGMLSEQNVINACIKYHRRKLKMNSNKSKEENRNEIMEI